MKTSVRRLLAILMACLLIPGLALSETFDDTLALPAFTLDNFPQTTTVSQVTVNFTGVAGYRYVLEQRYKNVWLAPLYAYLGEPEGTFLVTCYPGTNTFVLRNYGQTRNSKTAIKFTIESTAADSPTTVNIPTPTLRKGDKGAAVTVLQQVLTALDFYDGAIGGIFDEATRTAVKAAQKSFGITQDGIAGPKTLGLLSLTAYSVPVSSIGSAAQNDYQVDDDQDEGEEKVTGVRNLKKGMRGTDVKSLQQLLIDLGYAPGPVDGVFGPKTRAAVIEFQKASGITQDGIVGPVTRGKLTVSSAPANAEEFEHYLKKGSKGSEVKKVQKRLITLGYLNDKADGVFGPLTDAAVRAFQKDQKIWVDGIVGPDTYGRLFP